MHKILIVSATSGSNLRLAKRLEKSLDIEKEIVNLEDFIMPLYTPKVGKVNDEKIKDLCSKFSQSNGLIFCAPEYNGSIPPIITNAIAWMSVSTDYWRDAFNNKIGLIASSSGGPAIKYQIAMKNQLSAHIPKELQKYIISDNRVTEIIYPVKRYPKKIKSLKL